MIVDKRRGFRDKHGNNDYMIDFSYEMGSDSDSVYSSTYYAVNVGDRVVVECVEGGFTGVNYVTGVRY